MKVLHVLGSYPLPPLGGMESVVYHLSHALCENGVESRVVAPARRSGEVNDGGVQFYGARSALVSNWIQFPSREAYARLRELVEWADLVHVHNPPELFNLVAIAIVLRARKPIVVSLLSPGALRHHPKLWFRVAGRCLEPVLGFVNRHAALVQVKNTRDLRTVESEGAVARLIPDGVPLGEFTRPAGGERFRSNQRLESATPLLLYVGRLHPWKGPDQLVRALPYLLAVRPGVAVAIVGSDPLRLTDSILALASQLGVSDRVRVTGALDESAKLDAIDACDVLVVPTLADFAEGFSIVASEAWARGKPVAGYPVGALPARIHEGQDGALATAIQPPALAAAIERALQIRSVSAPGDVRSWADVAEVLSREYAAIVGGPGATARRGLAGRTAAESGHT